MAVDTSEGRKEMDYDEHLRTYDWFVKGTVWGTAALVLVLALLGLFVA